MIVLGHDVNKLVDSITTNIRQVYRDKHDLLVKALSKYNHKS